ncbi:MAG TPA: GFA family protein [Myxococcales bacterium]|nr:GFA family protein [Myxococcales bacterium]
MAEPRKYSGSCHCGNVRYEATMTLDKVMECNCSICGRIGAMRAFVPATEFKLLSGEDSLKDYQFGKQHLHHMFCKNCGIHTFAGGKAKDGTEMRAVNIRCLEGVDPWSLTSTHFEGKKL